jgi:hypothetical protein
LTATAVGKLTGIGDPTTVLASLSKTVREKPRVLGTYSRFVVGLIATSAGIDPNCIGGPTTVFVTVSTTEIELLSALATYTRFAVGSIATLAGLLPTGIGSPSGASADAGWAGVVSAEATRAAASATALKRWYRGAAAPRRAYD